MNPPIHASCVARRGPGGWAGVLLTGASGSGKSDMALRLIAAGWRLVADDYCHVWTSGGAIYAREPDAISGKMEVRGLGVVNLPAMAPVRIVLAVACQSEPAERMWAADHLEVAGRLVPRLQLDIRPASAVQVVEAAMAHLAFQPGSLSSI